MRDGQTVKQSHLLLFTFFLKVVDRCAISTVAQTEKKVGPRKRIKIDKTERKIKLNKAKYNSWGNNSVPGYTQFQQRPPRSGQLTGMTWHTIPLLVEAAVPLTPIAVFRKIVIHLHWENRCSYIRRMSLLSNCLKSAHPSNIRHVPFPLHLTWHLVSSGLRLVWQFLGPNQSWAKCCTEESTAF